MPKKIELSANGKYTVQFKPGLRARWSDSWKGLSFNQALDILSAYLAWNLTDYNYRILPQ